MVAYEAVLFDWSGTLVHDPSPLDRVRDALRAIGRAIDRDDLHALLTRLERAAQDADIADGLRHEDTAIDLHRTSNMAWFARADVDDELAEALYAVDADPANRPLYPDAIDNLATLKAHGVRVAVVSDIHLNLRDLLDIQGAARYIDDYVLSYEEGCQKPDPKMFLAALTRLGSPASATLMVGDRASHDGGAAAVGIATFILPPPPPMPVLRGLDVVPRIAGIA